MYKFCFILFFVSNAIVAWAISPHSTYHDTQYLEQRYPARRNYSLHLYESRQYYRTPPRKWFANEGRYQYQVNGPFHYSNYTDGPFPRGRIVTPPNDRTLKKQIQQSVHSKDIGVSVNGGNVTLQGVVNSQHERELIQDRISTMHGVFNIDNQIQVANTKPMLRERLIRPKDRQGRLVNYEGLRH